MAHDFTDTIAAIATPPGAGGIAILRISGPKAEEILRAIFRPTGGKDDFASHLLVYGRIVRHGEVLDEAMAVLMRAPRSFTREDVAELHCHGGHITCRRVLEAVLESGARMAEPGEFTRRAFENGRIDLAQAEATMRLIAAGGEEAARLALRQLSGALSHAVKAAQEKLISMLAALEAAVDFPDEVEETLTAQEVAARASALSRELVNACDARKGRVLQQGLQVVIAGRPNVGKSTLLNALLGEERAIVTAMPGTTRDMVSGSFYEDGLLIQVTDTAGLREALDPVEAIGVQRARDAMAKADVLLYVIDASEALDTEDMALLDQPPLCPRVIVLSKGDLPARLSAAGMLAIAPDAEVLSVSATEAQGVEALKALLLQYASDTKGEDALFVTQRHVQAAQEAIAALDACVQTLQANHPADLAAIDLRQALRALGTITGETVDEHVLDTIFADFCVGK